MSLRGPAWKAAGAILSAAIVVAPLPAHAADPAPAPGLEWSSDWPRFRWWEYGGTVLVEGASLYVRWYRPPPAQERWQGSNAFDDTIRGWLRAGTPAGRQLAGEVSDQVALGGMLAPYVVDLPVAVLVHRRVGVGWQMLMMDFEATAVANFANNLLFYEAGRARPDARDCAADATYDPLCNIGGNASFPSGHTVTVATAAGLTCVHHHYLPLYGNATADAAACGVMALATLTTGVTRIMSDRHFTTDVLVGAAIGFGSGYGLPWLLHYRTPHGGDARPANEGGVAVVPFGGPGGSVGLGLIGFR